MTSLNILVKTMSFYLESFHRYGVLKDVHFFLAHPVYYMSGRITGVWGDICADVEKSDCLDGIRKSIELYEMLRQLLAWSVEQLYIYGDRFWSLPLWRFRKWHCCSSSTLWLNRRRGGVQRLKLGGGHSELGAQSGRKNQPACILFYMYD